VIEVSYSSRDPARAAEIANAVADQFVNQQFAEKRGNIDRVYAWARAQSLKQLAELMQADMAAVDYMGTNGLMARNSTDRSGGGLAGQELISLQTDLAKARADRAAKEAKLNEVRTLSHNGGYASLPEVANSPVILD